MKLTDVPSQPFDFFATLVPETRTESNQLMYVAVMSTVRSDGESSVAKPVQRWVKVLQHKSDHKLSFLTVKSSPKVTEIESNTEVSLMFSSFPNGVYISMQAEAKIGSEKLAEECWGLLDKVQKVAWQSAGNISQDCNDDLKTFNAQRAETAESLQNVDAGDIKRPEFLVAVEIDVYRYEFIKEYPNEIYKADRFVHARSFSGDEVEKWTVKRLSP